MMIQRLIAFACVLLLTVKGDVVCPPSSTYAPCICVEIAERPGTIFVDCWDKPLGDSGVSRVLDAFLTTPNISQVGWVRLFNTQLTRIPDQMKSFPRLFWTDITGNKIPSIESGAFNFTENLEKLDLLGVELATIAPGAFGGNGYGFGTNVYVNMNKMTRFEATVYKSLLEKLAPYNNPPAWPQAFVQVYGNPFECDCHLAWLIRDNRHLLKTVYGGTCSDGITAFEDLDPNSFANCPIFECPLGYDGNYADPLSCSNYYSCTENKAILNECPTDLVFNPQKMQCDVLANVPSCDKI